nr:AAA family ATPase [Vibrio sp. L5-1]
MESKLASRFVGLDFKAVKKLKAIPDAQKNINVLEQQLVDMKSIDLIRQLPRPTTLELDTPILNIDFLDVSIEKISKEAEDKIHSHISDNMRSENKAWITTGTELVTEGDNCPFCGQGLNQSPIFEHYKHFLEDTFQTSVATFKAKNKSFINSLKRYSQLFHEAVPQVTTSNANIISWSERIDIEQCHISFDSLAQFDKNIEAYEKKSKKKEDDIFTDNADLITHLQQIESYITFINVEVLGYNKAIDNALSLIDNHISNLQSTNIATVNTQIDELKNALEFEKQEVQNQLIEINNKGIEKRAKDKEIKELRAAVAADQESNIKRLESAINDVLKGFGSSIRLVGSKKDHGNSNNRFVFSIKFIDKLLDVTKKNDAERVVSNLLSTGDKNALALAFFIAKANMDLTPNTIVVFDDPMCSLDKDRRYQTIALLSKIATKNQVLVFSHDAYFLNDIHDYQDNHKITSYFAFERTTHYKNNGFYRKCALVSREDLKKETIQSYVQDYHALAGFRDIPCDEPSQMAYIKGRIRPLLEAKIFSTDPVYFDEDDYLGTLIKKVRHKKDAGEFRISDEVFEKLEDVNDYVNSAHHAKGGNTNSNDINMVELQSHVVKTLECVNGL